MSDGGESLVSCKRSFSQHGVQIPPFLHDVQHSSGTAKLLRRQRELLSVGVQKGGEKGGGRVSDLLGGSNENSCWNS